VGQPEAAADRLTVPSFGLLDRIAPTRKEGNSELPPWRSSASPAAPVMAERGELLRWLLRRARRYPVTDA
jgi:hypothetical protein